jgi:hypothetical protein
MFMRENERDLCGDDKVMAVNALECAHNIGIFSLDLVAAHARHSYFRDDDDVDNFSARESEFGI